ncbi:transposase [Streptomyces sp. NPDC056004]|uniref:transposase n=1 Tax=Streptomyces sp. NPDC056004 TaxID=3345677 RepID=UPI0035DA1307
MPKPYPEEFREDVVRVARNRGPGVTIEQVAADFGVHAMTLWKWMRRADIDDGAKPGTTSQESTELPAPGLPGSRPDPGRRVPPLPDLPPTHRCRSRPGADGPAADQRWHLRPAPPRLTLAPVIRRPPAVMP